MSISLFRWRYLWLIAVPLGLAFCMWQASLLAREQALTNLQEEAENELRLSAANLNGYLLRYDYLPQMLATREGVLRFLASPERQDAMPLNLLLDRFRFTSGVSDVYLLDENADTIAASNWHRPNTFIGQNYAFRSYYRDAMAGGKAAFTAWASSPRSAVITFPPRCGWMILRRMRAPTASWWSRFC